MKLESVSIVPVAFADPPLLNCMGVHEPYALRSVIRLHFEDGLTGISESYGDIDFIALLERMAPMIVGLDVFALQKLKTVVTSALSADTYVDRHGLTGASSQAKTVASIYAAFEVGFLDAQGKLLNQPICNLLGGPVRSEVEFSAYLFFKWAAHPGQELDEVGSALEPSGIVEQARILTSRYGFRSLKLKGGVFPPEVEVEAIEALATEFPSTPLRWDPNAAWSVETACRMASLTDGLLEYLEDPTPGRKQMAEVARHTTTPLATNMCVVSRADLPEAVSLRSISVLLTDHHYWGGLRSTQEVAETCAIFEIGLSMHSNSHLGISLAAMVHAAATTPHLTYACDTHWPWKREDEDVIAPGALFFQDGAVAVPSGPGLGVELDEDALARLHEQYRSCGVRRRDDTAYMRSVHPEFMPSRGSW